MFVDQHALNGFVASLCARGYRKLGEMWWDENVRRWGLQSDKGLDTFKSMLINDKSERNCAKNFITKMEGEHLCAGEQYSESVRDFNSQKEKHYLNVIKKENNEKIAVKNLLQNSCSEKESIRVFLSALRQGYIDWSLLQIFQEKVGLDNAQKVYQDFAIGHAVKRIFAEVKCK